MEAFFFNIFVAFSHYLNFNENLISSCFLNLKSNNYSGIKIKQSPLLQYPCSQGIFTSLPFDGSGFFQGPNNWAFEGDWATSLSVNVRAALNSDHRHYNQDNGAFINFQACSSRQHTGRRTRHSRLLRAKSSVLNTVKHFYNKIIVGNIISSIKPNQITNRQDLFLI